jgi:hypothetical protein
VRDERAIVVRKSDRLAAATDVIVREKRMIQYSATPRLYLMASEYCSLRGHDGRFSRVA